MAKQEKKQQEQERPLSIYDRLLMVQESTRAMKKDKDAFGYKYLTGDKLLADLRPKLDEVGLLLLPEVTSFEHETVTYDAWNKDLKKVVQKTEILAKIRVRFTWVAADTGEQLVQEWAGSGMNAFDKGFGSALTYAERYYLLKVFHIATDRDDVDALAAVRDEEMELAATGGAAASQAPAPQPEPDPKPAPPKRGSEEWGKWVDAILSGWKSKNGKGAVQVFRATYDCDDDHIYALEEDAENRKNNQ